MLKTTLFLLSYALCIYTFSQNTELPKNINNIKKCGQFEALDKLKTEDPDRYNSYKQARNQLDHETKNNNERSGTIYTIPVVFHILHNNGAGDISDQQVQDAIDILNRDFRKLNSDVNTVYPSFTSIASDVKIEFAFAQKAPNGTCFNGITRTVTPETNNNGDGINQVNAVINGNDIYQGIWPHDKYLNIYVCKNVMGYAGYTYKPFGSDNPSASNMKYNGIFLKHTYCGSIGTSSVFRSRTLTHEVGHWLNLSHIWGDTDQGLACGDDNVPDTPITKGFSFCPNTPNDAKVCDPNIVENYENYMDYTRCRKMFTDGQASRMRTAIVSDVAGRSNIWTTENLEEVNATGSPDPLCPAKIDANDTLLCEGSSVTYSLTGVSEPVTSYSWTFPGGSPATSTQENPTVTYNTSGAYDVTLSITTASASKEISNISYMNVEAIGSISLLPFSEGFEDNTFPPNGWTLNNGGSIAIWKRSTKGTAPTPGSSTTLNFDTNTSGFGDIDDLNTPAVSLSGYSSSQLTFDVAYKPFSDFFYDKLEVLVSPGCGMPYQVVYSKEKPTLQTEPEGNGYSNPTVWRNDTIDLTPFVGNPKVRVKFRGISSYGNRIYIDNINITGEPDNFTISENSICQEETITFTSTATGATSWDWDFGDDAIPATATGEGPHTVTYSNSGNKEITLSLDGGTPSAPRVIEVKSLPAVSFSDLPTLCLDESPITLTQGTPPGGSYSGIGVTGNEFNPSVSGAGNQTITYTYTDLSSNCTNTSNQQITVETCLGIGEENSKYFKIFPNPTTGMVTISSAQIINEVVVLDQLGRTVFSINPKKSNQLKIDLKDLSSGVYNVRTNIGSITKTNKIIIK